MYLVIWWPGVTNVVLTLVSATRTGNVHRRNANAVRRSVRDASSKVYVELMSFERADLAFIHPHDCRFQLLVRKVYLRGCRTAERCLDFATRLPCICSYYKCCVGVVTNKMCSLFVNHMIYHMLFQLFTWIYTIYIDIHSFLPEKNHWIKCNLLSVPLPKNLRIECVCDCIVKSGSVTLSANNIINSYSGFIF